MRTALPSDPRSQTLVCDTPSPPCHPLPTTDARRVELQPRRFSTRWALFLHVFGGAFLLVGCDPCKGDVVVQTQSNLDAISECESIPGTLTVDNAAGVTDLQMPKLRFAGNLMVQDNASLASIDLPSLTNTQEGIYVGGNDALTRISMPSLTTAGDSLYITKNDALTSFDLTSLRTVKGFLGIYKNACLSQVGAQALEATVAHENGPLGTTPPYYSNWVYGNGFDCSR